MKVPDQDVERWNDDMARRYEPDKFITQTGWIVRRVEGARLDRCRRALRLSGTESVLDVGCGPGHLLTGLNAGRIVGVDLSDYLLAQARERLRGRENVALLKARAEALPFADQTFDRAVCSEVLEHVREPAAVVKEIFRVTKPGARVVFTLPNEGLINLSKRMVLALGLKKWVAGNYPMSDNMLDQWHLSEISPRALKTVVAPHFDLMESVSIPLPLFAYHTMFVLRRRDLPRL